MREAVSKIAGPYDNILVKSSVTASQDIAVTVTTAGAVSDEDVEARVRAVLAELLAVRKGRRLYELSLSDINHAIRSGYLEAVNVQITAPAQDVRLGKDKVIILGAVSVSVRRENGG